MLIPNVTARSMTIAAFKNRFLRYPDDALCCGTFWLADDFLSLDDTHDESTIEAAMERAQDCHDANIGCKRHIKTVLTFRQR